MIEGQLTIDECIAIATEDELLNEIVDIVELDRYDGVKRQMLRTAIRKHLRASNGTSKPGK